MKIQHRLGRGFLTLGSVLLSILLSGCISQDYLDNKDKADAIHNEMIDAKEKSAPTLSNVSYLTKPPAMTTPLPRDTSPSYLTETVSIEANRLPLSMVLSMLLDGTGIEVAFDPDVNPNQLVSLHSKASRKSILTLLSSVTEYGFTPNKETLQVGYYLSETFTLTLPPGTQSGQQGSEATTTGSEEDETQVEGQYLITTYDEVSIVNEVATAVEALLIDESDEEESLVGSVKVVPGLTALTVRTTPSRMAAAKRMIETYQAELDKQVLLDVRILEFRSNLGKDQGIDWNLVRDTGDGTLSFIIPGASGSSDISGGSGLAFEGTGDWEGTTAFIKALEQQGTVSTDTPISVLTLSSKAARISQTVDTPYLSDISTEVTDSTTSTSTTRGNVTEGIDMMVNTHVNDDFVWIRTSGKLTKIAGDTTEEVGDAMLRFISTRSADLAFTNKLRYGQTVVIGSVKQQTQSSSKSSSFGLDWLGSQLSGQETVETLVLLTPRRVK